MYIVSKTFRVEKAHLDNFVSRFNQPSPLFKFDGFIKREVSLLQTKADESVVRMAVYFEDKQAYYRWEGSPEHIAMHQKKHAKPEGLISVERQKYTLLSLDEKQ